MGASSRFASQTSVQISVRLTYSLTCSTQQSPSGEANRFSACLEKSPYFMETEDSLPRSATALNDWLKICLVTRSKRERKRTCGAYKVKITLYSHYQSEYLLKLCMNAVKPKIKVRTGRKDRTFQLYPHAIHVHWFSRHSIKDKWKLRTF